MSPTHQESLSSMTGEQLRAARHALGLTQAQLGRAIGIISKNTMSRKECGDLPITVSQARAVRGMLLEHYADDPAAVAQADRLAPVG